MFMKKSLPPFLLALGLALGTTACSDDDDNGGPSSQPAAAQSPETAIAWFDLLYAAIRDESLTPPVASRVIGYTGVAAYEAVVPGMPGHRSLVGQLNEFDSLPQAASGSYYWPAVLNSAVSTVLQGMFATGSAPTLQAIADLEATQLASFTNVAQGTLDRSETRGMEIGAAILDWAAGDEYDIWNACAYTAPVGPGLWEPTLPGFAPALQPCWGNLRPFVLLYGAECFVLPPPAYSLTTTSPFYIEALEVYDTVNNLTQPELDIALFWADNPNQTGTPPGHWISIVGQVVTQQDFDLDVAVEAYARVGLAVADAFISCWDMKYYYSYLRPITFIHDPAGINDPAWNTAPGVGTPPFPEYTSGHSVQSGAASLVLQDLWGSIPFDDDTHAGLFPMRSFDSFFEAADEAAISRLYGGIHFRTAIVRGVEQGYCVGSTILDEVEFRE